MSANNDFLSLPFTKRCAIVEIAKERKETYPDPYLSALKRNTNTKRRQKDKKESQKKNALDYIMKQRRLSK